MKELSYKYQVIEETIVGEKTFYKVKDIFDEKEVFVEEYKEVGDSDWDESSKVEEELEELKRNNKINDFFYTNDYSKGKKIFYVVHEDAPEEMLVAPEDASAPLSNQKEEEEEEIKEEGKGSRSGATTVPDVAVLHRPVAVLHRPIASLNDLGGKVKIDLPTIPKEEEEDIFSAPLSKPLSLDLDFKKSHSIAEMNKKIICKKCEVKIEGKHLNLEENIAYCGNCHAIRQIKKIGKKDEAKANIGMISPDGITVKNTSSMLYIETDLNVKSGFISIFVAIFMIFLGFNNVNSEFGMYILYAFAFALGYYGLLDLINKIHIEVTKNNIKIYSKPLPHFPMKNYSSKSISQLYVKEYEHKNKNNISYSYKLRAILKNGKDISLVKLDNSQYAVYLERSIESWLEIEDRKVAGEYK